MNDQDKKSMSEAFGEFNDYMMMKETVALLKYWKKRYPNIFISDKKRRRKSFLQKVLSLFFSSSRKDHILQDISNLLD